MPAQVERIYVVDDQCPEQKGRLVQERCTDPRDRLAARSEQGVGGAVTTAHRAALDAGMDIVIKIDGDGQMDPALIPHLTRPILRSKGRLPRTTASTARNRWPACRVSGCSATLPLSFINKLSTGYWPLMDPTNYRRHPPSVLRRMPLHARQALLFESDMLSTSFGTMRAVVHDVPMDAVYAGETIHLRVSRVLPEFPGQTPGALLQALRVPVPAARLQPGQPLASPACCCWPAAHGVSGWRTGCTGPWSAKAKRHGDAGGAAGAGGASSS